MSTTAMDELMKNPSGIAREIKAELEKGLEEGDLAPAEKEEIEAMLERPKPAPQAVRIPVGQRGEGGSGELRRSVEEEIEERRDAYGRNLEEVQDEALTSEGGEARADTYEEDAQSVGRSSELAGLHNTLESLKAYCDQNFAHMNSLLVSLSDRINRLEAKTSPSIPLAVLPGSPPRPSHHPSLSTSSAAVNVHVKNAPAAPRRPTVSELAIDRFLRENRSYPSFAGVRRAKVQALASGMGLVAPKETITPSEWNAAGLKKAIERAQE